MKAVNIIPLTFLLLTGCGGSSSSGTTPPRTNNVPDTPIVEECTDLTNITITATDDGSNDGHLPASTLDKSTDNDSRWSSMGESKYLTFDFGQTVNIKNLAILWYQSEERISYFEVETSTDLTTWQAVLTNGQSTLSAKAFESYELALSSGRYLRIHGQGNSVNSWNSIIEVVVNHCDDNTSILPEITEEPGDSNPSEPEDPIVSTHTIELNDWYLSIPTDVDGNGKSDSISENDLVAGYQNSDYFYPSNDGGLVFKVPVAGYKTSTNTSYTRTELREMLRRGNSSHKTQGINKNNWVFSTASQAEQDAAGGVDGTLTAELAVNYVTTTGDISQVGRVIIGQIHANDDEPIRLYYRKLPNNAKGAIYFAHEVLGGDDKYVEMIGSKAQSAANPSDGIALGERFSYQIEVVGNSLKVTISRSGKADVIGTYDMTASNYQSGGQYMYFKAGVYNQNNTGDAADYVQATFYKIENKHTGYNY
ncbi:MAG: polysaccharide lyase family 7 protein [Thalassotalea sp.]